MQNGIHIIIELVHLFFSPNFTVEVLKNCNGKLSWRSKIAGKSFVARNSNLTSNSPFEQFKKWKWNQKIWWWTPYQGGNVLLFRLRSFFFDNRGHPKFGRWTICHFFLQMILGKTIMCAAELKVNVIVTMQYTYSKNFGGFSPKKTPKWGFSSF